MAVTQNTYTGNGSTVLYSFTFPYLETTDIKVSVNGTNTTAYTLANATTVQFNTAPANGAAIRIYRETDDSSLQATFYPGSAIRSSDLNDNFTQNLYVTQEANNISATATTTANTALANSNTAISTANSAVSTANTASSNASAAVATANTASSNASAAVSTANTASSNATTAVNTANSAASNASTALSTANTALSTANTASSNASTALSTANTASTNASAAVSTANTASSNASSAVSTANTASSNASTALSTANTAISTANAAASAVANAILYDIVANVAAIPASPANNDAVEVTDSTGIQSFTPLTGRPAGFVGNSGLSVRLVYTTTGSTWNWIQYFPNDPETRYLKLSGGTLTGDITLAGAPSSNLHPATKAYVDTLGATKLDTTAAASTYQTQAGMSSYLTITAAGTTYAPLASPTFTGTPTGPSFSVTGSTAPTNGVYLPAANSVAISTSGTGRLFVDSSGRVGIGTSSPDSSLTITKDAAVGINIRSADANFSSLLFGCDTVSGFNFITSSTSGSGTLRPISFRMGASEAFRVDTSGRVGIGTTSAGGILHTLTTGSDNVNFFERASGAKFGIYNSSVNSYIGTFSNHDLRLATNDTERARIDTSGRLLVGTSSTSVNFTTALLQGNAISSTSEAALRLARGSSTPANGDGLGNIVFSDSNHGDAAFIFCARDGGTWNTSTSRPTRLVFSTCGDGASSPTERMRIKSNGTVEVSSSIGAGENIAKFTNSSSTGNGIFTSVNSDGTGYTFFQGYSASALANRILIYTNGNVVNANNSYGAISDAKLKENVVDANSQWDDLKALRVRNYNLKEGQTHTQIGLVAQEVELVSPGLVTESPDRDADGNDLGTVTKSVNYSVLYMKAVKALQEAMERIETLEAKVAALESA